MSYRDTEEKVRETVWCESKDSVDVDFSGLQNCRRRNRGLCVC